jgi:hypothetical protein
VYIESENRDSGQPAFALIEQLPHAAHPTPLAAFSQK